jgi:uncharacterized membrane protein
MRKFSFRPTLTFKGRTFKGLRGWAGKPMHPPLTDFPIAAYIFSAAFDVISLVGRHHSWSLEFWHAGTHTFIGGAAVSLLTALTGFWDWLKSTEKGTQARRTVNAHAWTMMSVTVLALIDIAVRLNNYNVCSHTPVGVAALSVVIAGLVSFGATYGGTLVYDYGFNVETAGDHPAWHVSETDVFPGDH